MLPLSNMMQIFKLLVLCFMLYKVLDSSIHFSPNLIKSSVSLEKGTYYYVIPAPKNTELY